MSGCENTRSPIEIRPHRGKYVPQEFRSGLIRHRLSIVKIRTMVKNKIHALIDKNGIETELEFSARREWSGSNLSNSNLLLTD